MSNISVVLCCYNSSIRLPKTLEHLALQNLSPNISCEIIVIDNNSSDNTFELAASEWAKLGAPFPLQTIRESKPGLSHARNTGVLSAKYQYICFCDDDNWLFPDYIQTAVEIMDADSSIGILAGQGIAVSDVEIPNWFLHLLPCLCLRSFRFEFGRCDESAIRLGSRNGSEKVSLHKLD